nr:FxsA family protein [uncultured Cohaesibacter sp.]
MTQKSLFPFIPFLLLAVPILEIGVFIIVGGQIGVLNTLLGVLLTAVIGTILLRQQGFALVGQAQQQMHQGKIPGKEMAHGVMLLAAGLLLLTPGFVTDTFGFLLLVPAIRDSIFHYFKSRVTLSTMQGQSFSSGSGFYQSYEYKSHDSSGKGSSPRPDNDDIIDLDESEFGEVKDQNALESNSASHSPWNKKS